jgi:large subunit ribosomal protein L29
MKAQEVRELESDELHARMGELKEELFNLRFQLATGQLDNHGRMKAVRRDVARIHTILRERDFMAVEQVPPTAPAPAEAPETTEEAEEE